MVIAESLEINTDNLNYFRTVTHSAVLVRSSACVAFKIECITQLLHDEVPRSKP